MDEGKRRTMFIPQSLFGTAGYPAGRGMGAVLHNFAFQAWNIPATFLAWDIAPEDLPDFIHAAALLNIAGFTVEAPHKDTIIPLLDRLSPQATRVGAVDTVYKEDGGLVGHNAQANAFRITLPAGFQPETALILGSGAGARAALSALLSPGGPARIILTGRVPEEAPALIASVQPVEIDEDEAPTLRRLPQVSAIPWKERHDARADLIINTTPLGLPGSPYESESPLSSFHGQGLAYDFPIGSTPFLNAARASGWQAMDGRAMLLEQAREQFILWTGFPMPDTIEDALNNYI